MKTVLVDNQKAAVLKNSNGNVVFNAGFLLLADHYGFLPRACRPRRARIKGKVERMVKYLKENFFVRYRKFDSFTHVNQLLEQWIADVADRGDLRQFRETPAERLSLEQAHLQPLPTTDFDTSYFDIRHVSWDGYIEVGGNRYLPMTREEASLFFRLLNRRYEKASIFLTSNKGFAGWGEMFGDNVLGPSWTGCTPLNDVEYKRRKLSIEGETQGRRAGKKRNTNQ